MRLKIVVVSARLSKQARKMLEEFVTRPMPLFHASIVSSLVVNLRKHYWCRKMQAGLSLSRRPFS
jgi:hypothetical protein